MAHIILTTTVLLFNYFCPDTERNLNTANCQTEAAAENDYFWGKQMWWNTRAGL